MFVLQVWSQRVLSYETSAILLTLEAPFAIFFLALLLGLFSCGPALLTWVVNQKLKFQVAFHM